MLRKDSTHHILINTGAEGGVDLIGNARTAPRRIAPLHLDHGANDVGFRSFGPGLGSPLRREQQLILSPDHGPMKVKQGGRFDRDSNPSQTHRFNEKRAEAGDHAIPDAKIRCSTPRPIRYEQLVFQQHRFRNNRTNSSWAGNAAERNDGMEQNSEQIAHW
jgi:hypothetical protein